MTDDALRAAGPVVEERIGLRLDGAVRGRLRRVLAERARSRGLTPRAYADGLRADPAEVDRLIEAVTVQESRFFRDPAHFAVLRRLVAAAPAPDAIWSAGCANGQEPWSVAMLLEEARADGWRVLATDISDAALARTAAGVYGERELAGLSATRRHRFLTRTGDGWRVADALRDRVVVRRHNLATTPPPPEAGACRIVLCRNVLIYLRRDDAERALRRIGERMPPDGRLVLGAAETLPSGRGGFVPEQLAGIYVYRPAPPAPPVPPPALRARPAAAAPAPAAPDAGLTLALARERIARRGGDA